MNFTCPNKAVMSAQSSLLWKVGLYPTSSAFADGEGRANVLTAWSRTVLGELSKYNSDHLFSDEICW
jgi:hypothetical protein